MRDSGLVDPTGQVLTASFCRDTEDTLLQYEKNGAEYIIRFTNQSICRVKEQFKDFYGFTGVKKRRRDNYSRNSGRQNTGGT